MSNVQFLLKNSERLRYCGGLGVLGLRTNDLSFEQAASMMCIIFGFLLMF